MFISAGYNPKLEKAFSKFYQSSFPLIIIQCWIENFSGPCFVLALFFSLYLELVCVLYLHIALICACICLSEFCYSCL